MAELPGRRNHFMTSAAPAEWHNGRHAAASSANVAQDEESTMDQARIVEMALRIEHRHGDGTWGEFQEDRSHHSPSDHDPERSWGIRRIFRCTSCGDSMTVIEGEEGGAGAER